MKIPIRTLRERRRTRVRAEGDARARATECAGLLLGCVDRDRALHFAPGLARAALPALGTDSPELREYTFGFFSHLFEAVGPAAAELLPAVYAGNAARILGL